MKLTAQADFYISNLGIKAGVKYLKELGYQNIIYNLTPKEMEMFPENEEHFQSIRETIEKEGIEIPFTILDRELYLDHAPQEYEARKAVCLAAVKTTALMGSTVMGVRPICFRESTPNAFEESKKLTYELYSDIKKEADAVGVKLAFFNNTKQLCFTSGTYSYGCRAEELLELADAFESGIILDPVYALKAGERIEELLRNTREKLLGFCITDMAQRELTGTIPMFGGVDYQGLTEFFKHYESDAAMVIMYTPILKRYTDFISSPALRDILSKTFLDIATLISGNATANGSEEQML